MKVKDIVTIRNSIIAGVIVAIIGAIINFSLNKNSAKNEISIVNSNNVSKISIDNSKKNYDNSTVIENQNIERQVLNYKDKETEEKKILFESKK